MSMTNHPIASSSAQMLKSHDCRARDIKRRLDVIQKKMADLQELGVPCAFCYISVRNTGSLFTMGNKAMTQIIEKSRDVILENLSEIQSTAAKSEVAKDQREIHMVLPPLPQPLAELNLHDLRALIVGIIKDLGIKWSDKKPPFWPENIPFQYPRTAPEGFQGCWTKTLREIVSSMYNYFDYNPDTYYKCSTPATASLNRTSGGVLPPAPPSLSQSHFFPETGHVSLIETRPENTCNDEEEEIDVGVSYATTQSHDASHDSVHSMPSDSLPLQQRYSEGNYPSQSDEQDDDEEDDNETISVCSDHEPTTINYFGYEMARGESTQTSPLPAASQHQSDSELSSSTPSPRPHPLIQQPQLLYCSPQLYSQLYPTLPTMPFLLPPNLLMKNPLAYSTSTTQEGMTKTQKVLDKEASSVGISTTALNSLAVPYALPRPLQLSPLNLQSSPTLPLTYQPLPTNNSVKSVSEETSLLLSRDTNDKTPPLTSAPTQQQEPKSGKKGRNHGIYIYTTPSEPLKFMSLGSEKNNGRKLTTQGEKKLVAMAPIVPPIGLNGGETVILKDNERNFRQQAHQTMLDKEEAKNSHPKTQTRSQAGLNPVTASRNGSKKPNGSMKRRRELVFHWYHSPENQPSSTSPPSSKRMNTAGTV